MRARILSLAVVFLAAVFFAATPAHAQYTLVTGTITDPNGLPYANGTISAQIIPNGGSPTLNGQSFTSSTGSGLSTVGGFTMTLADNNVVLPSGTQWQFTVHGTPGGVAPPIGTGPQSFVVTLTITGAFQSISAALSAAAPAQAVGIGGSSVSSVNSLTGTVILPGVGSSCPANNLVGTIRPDCPPFNIPFDLLTSRSGSMTNGSAVLNDANGTFVTSVHAGERVEVVDTSGKLAASGTVGSIQSQTQLTITGPFSTSVCPISNPCTGMAYAIGSPSPVGSQAAFVAAIGPTASPATDLRYVCGILLGGGTWLEVPWSDVANANSPFGICLHSIGHTLFVPTVNLQYDSDLFLFANAVNIGSTAIYTYGGIEVDGLGLATTDGRVPGGVYQGVAANGGGCFFLGGDFTGYFADMECHDIGFGVTGWTCVQLASPAQLYDVTCQNAGTAQADGGQRVSIHEGLFTNLAGGPSLSTTGGTELDLYSVTTDLISAGGASNNSPIHCFGCFGYGRAINAFGNAVAVSNGSNVYWDGGRVVAAASGTVNAFQTQGAGLKTFFRNVTITAPAGKIADNSLGGNNFNMGGNDVISGTSDDHCVSATGACGGAHEGEITVAAAATTRTVATTAVTAASRITIMPDATLGADLSVTCNVATNTGAPFVSARTPGTSFVVTLPVTPAVNPGCYRFEITNPGE